MKKTFLAKRNSLLLNHGVSWGVFALAFALFVLLMRLFTPNLFWQVFSPIFRTSDAISSTSHTFLNSFGDAERLTEQNAKLTTENAALASENQTLMQKTTNLSALLGASATQQEPSSILAGVIARPPMSPYDTLVLSVGNKEGVTLGMEAFGETGVPVGVVSSVLDDFSQLTLFSTPGIVTNGWVGHTSIPVSLVGAGAGAIQSFVARAANIAVGDTVYVPGPGMLPIGSIVRIDSDPLSPGVTLRIRPAVNPFSISWIVLRATGVTGVAFATSTLP
jgi:cell shape-determining protein MreC